MQSESRYADSLRRMQLKGLYMKEYYPKIGMRKMWDNDILIYASWIYEIDVYMNQ